MNKLSELLKFFPRRSGVSVPCEVVPGHSDTKFVEIQIDKTTLVNIDGVSKPITAKITIRACSSCWHTFVYEATLVSKELQTDGG